MIIIKNVTNQHSYEYLDLMKYPAENIMRMRINYLKEAIQTIV